jgi:hypothetical protein
MPTDLRRFEGEHPVPRIEITAACQCSGPGYASDLADAEGGSPIARRPRGGADWEGRRKSIGARKRRAVAKMQHIKKQVKYIETR